MLPPPPEILWGIFWAGYRDMEKFHARGEAPGLSCLCRVSADKQKRNEAWYTLHDLPRAPSSSDLTTGAAGSSAGAAPHEEPLSPPGARSVKAADAEELIAVAQRAAWQSW